MLLAEVTGDEKYMTAVQAFCDYVVYEVPRTPKGLVFILEWGSLRHAANVAYISLLVSQETESIGKEEHRIVPGIVYAMQFAQYH